MTDAKALIIEAREYQASEAERVAEQEACQALIAAYEVFQAGSLRVSEYARHQLNSLVNVFHYLDISQDSDLADQAEILEGCYPAPDDFRLAKQYELINYQGTQILPGKATIKTALINLASYLVNEEQKLAQNEVIITSC
jgi:hypothetical protein